MRVINAINVHDALREGTKLLVNEGEEITPRNMLTIEYPTPVTTVYANPLERVMFPSWRDANPFFHLVEAIWIIAGENKVHPIIQFNSQMINYSDDGKVFRGAYGYRLRNMRRSPTGNTDDQIEDLVTLMKNEPDTRRAVLQIWNAGQDLNVDSRDLPCNTMIFLKIRGKEGERKLHMRVLNRSNDIIWGCYGANYVQFSFLMEYLAARLGVEVGTLTQISDSFHVYPERDMWGICKEKLNQPWEWWSPYDKQGDAVEVRTEPLCSEPEAFYGDALEFTNNPFQDVYTYDNRWFDVVAVPMMTIWKWHKEWLYSGKSHSHRVTMDRVIDMGFDVKQDWIMNGIEWVQRREQ